MIIQLGGRSTEDARALLERALTEMKPKKAAPPERTAAQDRLEATRMRDKIRGTTKMRAAIAGALDKLHDSVLRAVGLREADGDDDEQTPSQFAAAADAAAAGWDDAVFSDAIDEIVRELFEKAGTGAAAELKTSWDLVPESAIDALLREELAFSKQFVDRERIALRAMLKDALANGTPVRELADEIRDFFANGVHYVDEKGNVGRTMPADSWAETVARTETSRAYNAGHMAMYRANDTKRIRWLTAEDERVCPECAELEQATTAVGEPFPGTDVTEPPLHPNCAPAGTRILALRGVVPIEQIRVGDLVVTHRNRLRVVRALSRSDVSANLIELRVGPHVLRVTEEHPIFTSQGWAPAASLKPGDEIRAVKAEPRLGGAGETDEIPTGRLQEDFLRHVVEPLFAETMPRAAVDLDRKLAIGQRDVEIVDVEREVRYARNAGRSKRRDNDRLVLRFDEAASCLGALQTRFTRRRFSAHGVVRGLREVLALVGRRLGHADEHRVASTAHRKPQSQETRRDRGARDARSFGKGEHRFAGEMPSMKRAQLVVCERSSSDARQLPPIAHTAIVRLSSATRVAFSGVVFNFGVDEDESYIAEGIVSHNCRCTTIGVWPGEAS